jgi:prophage tail gpP-like protein
LVDATLLAQIVAGGSIFSGWESIEISRVAGETKSYMRFRYVENTSTSPSSIGQFSSLVPGVPCMGYLAGQLAITGAVETRQAVLDPNSHGVEIIVAGLTAGLDYSTVDANPGEYKNQTVQQIASAIASKVGVNVVLKGDTSGADLPFDRVQEHVGERRIDIIRRLAMWRNLHLCDDANGNLTLMRQGSGMASAGELVEGKNCEILRAIMSFAYTNDEITVVSQTQGNDDTNGSAASQVKVSQSNPNYSGNPRPLTVMGDHPGNQQEAQMYLSHLQSLMDMQMLEGEFTVPGWLRDDGTLWIAHIFEPIAITSPSMFPQNSGSISLYIKGARHLQDAEGTHTVVIVSLYSGLGQDPVNVNPPSVPGAYTNPPGGPGTSR